MRDGDAGDVDGLEHREGQQVARPPHVPDDLVELRRRGRRGELPGDRPARVAARDAELSLQAPVVHLDDDAVDLEVELVAAALPPAAALRHVVDALMQRDIGVHAEAVLAQPLEHLGVAVGLPAPARTDPIGPHRERARGCQLRVELTNRAGGRVPRVGEGREALGGALLVQLREVSDRQVDLAAHLDQLRRVFDPQRDRLHRAQVLRHLLADAPVAARGAAGQHAVLVGERDREAVHLRLGHVADLLALDVEPLEAALDALGPSPQLVLVAGVAERQHRLGVLDPPELLEGHTADALGRRVGGDELGIGLLELAQLAQQVVVVGVGDRRVVVARSTRGRGRRSPPLSCFSLLRAFDRRQREASPVFESGPCPPRRRPRRPASPRGPRSEASRGPRGR